MSSFSLKIAAVLFMTLDHIYTYIPSMPDWFGYLGKLAAPIFFFLIIEGYFHTRDLKKYAIRLSAFAVLMVGVDYLFKIGNNIFLSLVCGVLLAAGMDYSRKYRKDTRNFVACLLCSILAAVALCFTEASIYGLGMVLVFYLFRGKKGKLAIAYILLCMLVTLPMLDWQNLWDCLFIDDYQWMMVFAFPFFLLYNGERGFSNKLVKWSFYVYYPLHLIVVVQIAQLFPQ